MEGGVAAPGKKIRTAAWKSDSNRIQVREEKCELPEKNGKSEMRIV